MPTITLTYADTPREGTTELRIVEQVPRTLRDAELPHAVACHLAGVVLRTLHALAVDQGPEHVRTVANILNPPGYEHVVDADEAPVVAGDTLAVCFREHLADGCPNGPHANLTHTCPDDPAPEIPESAWSTAMHRGVHRLRGLLEDRNTMIDGATSEDVLQSLVTAVMVAATRKDQRA
jgi:hypothetical protein